MKTAVGAAEPEPYKARPVHWWTTGTHMVGSMTAPTVSTTLPSTVFTSLAMPFPPPPREAVRVQARVERPREIADREYVSRLWAEDWDHTLYFPERTVEWRKLPLDQQILAGGYYTVYVTPAQDPVTKSYRLTTTIRVK